MRFPSQKRNRPICPRTWFVCPFYWMGNHLEAGYPTGDVAENAAAMSYRQGLARRQTGMAAAISTEALDGEPLDVVWNLTLAANLISANVPYGKMEAIRELSGVQDVILETRYAPCVVDREEAADPNMATSSQMIGTHNAWAAGYTGVGSRIAVIDTGIDTDHQSFDAAAFDYSLEQQKAQPILLDAAEISQKLSKLNIAGLGYAAKDLYVSSKIAFGFNYVDENLDITHDHDDQGSTVPMWRALQRQMPTFPRETVPLLRRWKQSRPRVWRRMPKSSP